LPVTTPANFVCHIRQVANVYRADARVPGGGAEGALLLDTLPEIQEALHVEIRAQKGEREAGRLDGRFDRRMIAQEPSRRARVRV
jgi:hypothetical protein